MIALWTASANTGMVPFKIFLLLLVPIYLGLFTLDIFALTWTGMWFGLTSKNETRAITNTIALIMLVAPALFPLWFVLQSGASGCPDHTRHRNRDSPREIAQRIPRHCREGIFTNFRIGAASSRAGWRSAPIARPALTGSIFRASHAGKIKKIRPKRRIFLAIARRIVYQSLQPFQLANASDPFVPYEFSCLHEKGIYVD